jgi:hypothetical protein
VGLEVKLLNDRITRNEGPDVIIRSLGFKLKRRSHLPRVTTVLVRRRLPHLLQTIHMVTSVPPYPFFSFSLFSYPVDHSLSLTLPISFLLLPFLPNPTHHSSFFSFLSFFFPLLCSSFPFHPRDTKRRERC